MTRRMLPCLWWPQRQANLKRECNATPQGLMLEDTIEAPQSIAFTLAEPLESLGLVSPCSVFVLFVCLCIFLDSRSLFLCVNVVGALKDGFSVLLLATCDVCCAELVLEVDCGSKQNGRQDG